MVKGDDNDSSNFLDKKMYKMVHCIHDSRVCRIFHQSFPIIASDNIRNNSTNDGIAECIYYWDSNLMRGIQTITAVKMVVAME